MKYKIMFKSGASIEVETDEDLFYVKWKSDQYDWDSFSIKHKGKVVANFATSEIVYIGLIGEIL